MRKEWKAYVEEFRTAEIGFVHRDELWELPCSERVSKMPLPVIGYCSGSDFQVLITAFEMAELKDVSALTVLLKKRTKKSRIL
ncbi:hypothetical protein [Robertkochia aurantiaca]|uniref:hypothetical protein n=1 Tax=Robertkochia aurantiaca TaxID=2873700 RepID=UPI001CCE5E7A|nr:hypothetical protein [Robertkochia sp. 3YJGBD-33]